MQKQHRMWQMVWNGGFASIVMIALFGVTVVGQGQGWGQDEPGTFGEKGKNLEERSSKSLMWDALNKQKTNARGRASLISRVRERRLDLRVKRRDLNGSELAPFALAIIRDEAEHEDVRASAVRLLATIKKPLVIEFLLEAMAYKNSVVAEVAHSQMFSLTRWEGGKFDEDASHEKRKEQANEWQKWWERHRDEVEIKWQEGGYPGY